ncbi:cathepsin L-like peptidase [Saccoglossus kowalevskii]|uniref:Cathepsin L-like n=1 Tax=Saccoglossus kowalevskii TaxID=10224 RepID=A0ABM0GLA6_SACKO|nr:PREDICTED: cathepsin L-like [Saccoglossus kowalevskii]
MKMFISLALVAMAAATSVNTEWESWKRTYGKEYTQKEEALRHMIWNVNLKMIQMHNEKYMSGKSTYTQNMNQFGDLTNEEYRELMCGYKKSNKTVISKPSTFLLPSNYRAPASIDWRTQGYVTDVKDQGACGSCWAFSSTGSLEGQTFKKTGKLVPLSEQQLVDCSGDYGNMGCGGGWMDQAFSYIKDKGEESEDGYPYTGTDDTCVYDASKVVATDTGYTDIPEMDENALQQAVATVGPISVAIDATHSSFQFYESGVYDEPECSQTNLDHAVLAVGYGTSEEGLDYWIVKNSWSTGWGMQGYIEMSRNKDNQCGIASKASYPVV